ncbi:MAG: hypothetical protein R6U04_12545 [Bacteroidales bacterium]
MSTQLELDVVTEQNMSLIARLLLILNKKQLTLNAMKVDLNYSTGLYKYNFQISGNTNLMNQAVKVMSKQIGVFDITANAENLVRGKNKIAVSD